MKNKYGRLMYCKSNKVGEKITLLLPINFKKDLQLCSLHSD